MYTTGTGIPQDGGTCGRQTRIYELYYHTCDGDDVRGDRKHEDGHDHRRRQSVEFGAKPIVAVSGAQRRLHGDVVETLESRNVFTGPAKKGRNEKKKFEKN